MEFSIAPSLNNKPQNTEWTIKNNQPSSKNNQPSSTIHHLENNTSDTPGNRQDKVLLTLSGGSLEEILIDSVFYEIMLVASDSGELIAVQTISRNIIEKYIESNGSDSTVQDSTPANENNQMVEICNKCIAWYEASVSNLSGSPCKEATTSPNAGVKCWRDKSGQKNHANIVNDNESGAPVYSPFSDLNPANVSFTKTSSLRGYLRGFSGGNHPYTIILVYSLGKNNLPSGNGAFSFGIGTSNNKQCAFVEDRDTGTYATHWYSDFKLGGPPQLHKRRIIAITYDGLTAGDSPMPVNFTARIEGASQEPTPDDTYGGASGALNLPQAAEIHLGWLNSFEGKIYEAAFYDRALGPDEIISIEAAMQQKWSL